MYADVELAATGQGKVLTVPASAVIHSGTRQMVLVELAEGRFEPREVKLGMQGNDYVEVLEGVAEGEKVVVTANFLIDAESNLKAAFSGMRQAGAADKPARSAHRQTRDTRGTEHARPPHRVVGAQRLPGAAGHLVIIGGGIYAVLKTPLDALPDLSDVQVIVYTEYSGQAPQVVEDQVTYPLTTAMLSVPKSKVVRGFSFFGASFVYIIFEDGTDIYWARSRVLEYLNFAAGRLPQGVSPQLGPDATGVGWVYQYAVLAKNKSLAELRTMQDWYLRYQLTKAHGRGGSRQHRRLRAAIPGRGRSAQAAGLRRPADRVSQVIRDSNRDVGGRVIEMAETEYMVRGKGYLRGKSDLEQLVVKSEKACRCCSATSPASSWARTSGAA